MDKMLSKITTKGTATIPAAVRTTLGLKPGDFVEFKLARNTVTLTKFDRLDTAFVKLAEEPFADWNSNEDEEAFRDL
jgi:AbrB family looped-hinge helix DNA binding protein